jgi:hypothetical protein
VIVSAGKVKLLVKKIRVFSVSGSLNASQWRFEALVRVEGSENDGLSADQPGAAVDRMRVTPLEP